jgi:hypothetical protein
MSKILTGVLLLTLYLQGAPKLLGVGLEPVGVDSLTTRTASRLLEEFLIGTEKFQVLSSYELEETISVAKGLELARDKGADKLLMGSLAQLGEKLIVSLRLWDVKSESLEYSDRLTAATIEDLDKVLERAAFGIAEAKRIEATAQVGRITEAEVPRFRTRAPLINPSLRVGYLYPLFSAWDQELILSGDFALGYETPQFFTEGIIGGSNAESGGEFRFDILVYKIFSQKDLAPFLGGGAGIHQVWYYKPVTYDWGTYNERVSQDGPALNIAGGIMAFRTYDFRLLLSGRYTLTFARLGQKSTQHGFTMTLGLTTPPPPTASQDVATGATACIGGCIGLYILTILLTL